MTMMFEVEDLEVASPATVSRCGMVYMEPGSLGTKVIYDSWIERLPENILARKRFVDSLRKYFEKYVDITLEFVRENIKELVKTMDNNLVQSLTHIIQCFMEDFRESEIKKISTEDLDALESKLEAIFIFALTWSFGCTGDWEGRVKFDKFIRKNKSDAYDIPVEIEGQTALVFDFSYEIDQN